MPLSPMYPPREEREETPAPVNEFAAAMWFGALWLAFAAVQWALSGSGRRAVWKILVAAGWAINAVALKFRWTSKKRWTVLGVLFALAAGAAYLVR